MSKFFRAFFRRGVPKQLRCIFGHKQCKINQHNRTNCKLCRCQRCLETGMRPDKVNKYLNRRKEREAMIARCGGLPGEQKKSPKPPTSPEQAQPKSPRSSEQKQQQSTKMENYTYAKPGSLSCDPAGYPHLIDATGYPSRPAFDWGYSYGPAHPPQKQVTWQSEMTRRVDQSVIRANNDNVHIPDISYKKPMSSPLDDKIVLDLSQKSPSKMDVIYPTTVTEIDRGTSPDSSSGSSVIRFASSKLGRPEVVVLKEENSDEKKEVTEKTIRDNPVLPFTLEEEFKVIDFIVRIEDYFTKRFVFIDKNFGGGGFPEYKKLTMENAACTKISGKLPYDPMMEGRLFNLALNFTQLNIDHFYDEMKRLSPEVKIKMLTTSFPATYVIFYAILENNNAMQPLSLGQEKVGNIRMRDMERFTSPWALDYADEVKFNNTVQRVGEVLGSDMKLQALYHMLVMMTPYDRQVCLQFFVIQ